MAKSPPSLTPEKLLQSQGFGSRKECEILVRKGLFSLDSGVIKDLKYALPLLREGRPLEYLLEGVRHIYRDKAVVALNKPTGYECSASPQHHSSVFDLLPDYLARRGLQPVGRLDQDTTGLLLFTDDGPLAHRLTSPKHHVPKTYRVITRDPVTPEQAQALLEGVQLHGEPAPDRALAVSLRGEREFELVIDQGKYHQVRRMTAAAGNFCVALERVAFGSLTMASLGLTTGAWCFLPEDSWTSL